MRDVLQPVRSILVGHLAEIKVIDNAHATAALKECWKHRLQVLKKDLGYDEAPLLEKLLIQQAALVLVQTQPCGVELLRHNGSINHADARDVLGETFDGRAEAIHSSL